MEKERKGKMQIIGVDTGRSMVKVVSGKKRYKFPSKVGEAREMNIGESGDFLAEIDGEKFFVGNLSEESYFARSFVSESKLHEDTKTLFLTAIGLVADPNEDKIMITTGLPISQHVPEIKKQFVELLAGEHVVKINNKSKIKFTIQDNIGIVPEGGGAYWDVVLDQNATIQDEIVANLKVRCIDIGSRTTNFCSINAKRYLDRDSGTLNYGILELYNAKKIPTDDDCKQMVRRIVGDLSKRWLDDEYDVLLLAGGGSLMLEKFLRQAYPMARIVNDAEFSNASGYWKMGVAKWQNSLKK